MTVLYYILSAVLGAVIALGSYIAVRRILLKGQKEEIIKKAEIEAEGIKKEKIFFIKEILVLLGIKLTIKLSPAGGELLQS